MKDCFTHNKVFPMRLPRFGVVATSLFGVDSFPSLLVPLSQQQRHSTTGKVIVLNEQHQGQRQDHGSLVSSRRRPFHRPTTATTSTTSHSMCICIDCARVTNCAAYHFVETKHSQPHMTEHPTFEPRPGSPTIHANIRTVDHQITSEMIDRIYREHKTEEEEANTVAAANALSEFHPSNQEHDIVDKERPLLGLYGKTVYDLSSATTIEYDVVACEDFIEDRGCW